MSKMALHEPFGHLQHKLWQKERMGVKLESSRPWCVQVECDTQLESSQGELQICFRPHPNRRSEQKVMNSQSLGSPEKPFGCGCREVTQRILDGGRWWLPPSLGCGESCESRVARGLS